MELVSNRLTTFRDTLKKVYPNKTLHKNNRLKAAQNRLAGYLLDTRLLEFSKNRWNQDEYMVFICPRELALYYPFTKTLLVYTQNGYKINYEEN